MAELTQAQLRGLLNYDPETGVFTWRAMRPGVNRTRIAGCIRSDTGYWVIRIDGHLYRAHRLAWFFMTGEWPPNQIDHVNGNRLDNRWGNLRSATNSQNHANQGVAQNNTSGFKGVSFHKKAKKWGASIRIDNQSVHLGLFDNPEEAHAAYAAKARELFGEFARVA